MDLNHRLSSGRGPYIFRVDSPCELFSVHGDLIGAYLHPDEKLLYLLYSPIWEGDRAHFSIHSYPASPTLAVTTRRFLINAALRAVLRFSGTCAKEVVNGVHDKQEFNEYLLRE